jgi:flagellar motor switch protein FliN
MSSSPISSSSSDARHALAGMLDVVCAVDVVLGTGTISVRDCLKLQPRSVIRLVQPSGADVDIRVHDVSVARGEIVIMDDSTAVRINEIVPSPSGEVS